MKIQIKKLLTLTIDLILIAGLASYVSLMAGVWSGYPNGAAGLDWLQKFSSWQANWPDGDWIFVNGHGQPFTANLAHILTALIDYVTGSTVTAFVIILIGSGLTILFSLYLLTREVTGNRLAALLVPVLIMSLHGFWGLITQGDINLLLALSLLALTIWVLVKITNFSNLNRLWPALAVLILTGALCSHFPVSLVAIMAALTIFWFNTKSRAEFLTAAGRYLLPAVGLSLAILVPNLLNQTGNNQQWATGFNHPAVWLTVGLTTVLLYQAVSRQEKKYERFAGWSNLKAMFYLAVLIVIGFLTGLIQLSLVVILLSLLLPVIIGLSFHYAFHDKKREFAVFILIMAIAVGLINWQFPFTKPALELNRDFLNSENNMPTATPEATNARTLLLIGQPEDYQNTVTALAKTGIDPKSVVTIAGQPILDLYSIDELVRFDAIFLNNFNYYNQSQAMTLLDRYVTQGGSVVMESSGVFSQPEGVVVPDPLPVKKINFGDFGTEWELKATGSALTQEVDLSAFAPAIYGNFYPWSQLHSRPEDLRADAEIILTNHDQVVMAMRRDGTGQLIWSGLNLIYHYTNYNNPAELKLIENIFRQALRLADQEILTQSGLTIGPDHQEITIEQPANYRGVLLKDRYHANWQAHMNDQITSKPKVYRAAADQMYVFLPAGNTPVTLSFNFDKNPLEYLALAGSLLVLIYLISLQFVKK